MNPFVLLMSVETGGVMSVRRGHTLSGGDHTLSGTHGQNRVWYISAGNELEFWLLF